MKHIQTILAVAAGVVVGIAIGYYVGNGSAAFVGTATYRSTDAGRSDDAPQAFGAAGERGPETEWIAVYQQNLKKASPGQPTPSIVDTIGEALRSDPPLDTARLLFLIQTMRKEDFPVALGLFQTVKSNINTAYVNANGPIAWAAFWQQFGAIDPKVALAHSLECEDLAYTGRNQLEKHLFIGLARNNIADAARTFLAIPDLANRQFAAAGLTYEWAKTNPSAAVAWAQQNLTAEALDQASFAAMWGASNSHDISRGNSLLETIPAGEVRMSAVRSLKNQIKSKPNVPATQIIDFMMTARNLGAQDESFEKDLASRCVESDPIAAANFYSQPGAGNTEAAATNLRTVLRLWVAKDRAAAENWARGQVGTDHYDLIVTELASAK